MEKDKNIFETASKKLGSKGKKKIETKEQKIQPAAFVPTPERRYRDAEINEMMKQIDEMSRELRYQLESASKKAGRSYDGLRQLVENPKNFTPEAWAFIQKNRDLLSEKVWNSIGVTYHPQAPQETPTPEAPRRENKAGERKGKTLGARKKWISVH
jgi:hypothetical protein